MPETGLKLRSRDRSFVDRRCLIYRIPRERTTWKRVRADFDPAALGSFAREGAELDTVAIGFFAGQEGARRRADEKRAAGRSYLGALDELRALGRDDNRGRAEAQGTLEASSPCKP